MDRSDISKFSTITHASEEEAQHYLEAFNGDCDEAVKAYFEAEENHLQPDTSKSLEDDNISSTSPNNCVLKKPGKMEKSSGTSKIATLQSVASDGSDDDGQQAFYVGGSETGGGGQQVLGPPDRRIVNPTEAPDRFVQGIFRDARNTGAQELNVTNCCMLNSDKKKQIPFSGTGYKLGADANASVDQEIDPSTSHPNSSSSATAKNNVIVKLWRNGFSLDDGPLHSYNEAESNEFIDSIRSGRIPQALHRYAGGGAVHVMLEDHHHENYVAPPAPKVKPFSGKGQMLGFPTPLLVQNCTSTTETNIPAASAVEVDDTKPVTQIQVCAPDGKRLLIRLNHSHTIGDIRRAISNERSDLGDRPFDLMVAYPSRKLTDDQQTLVEANLLNAVLRLI